DGKPDVAVTANGGIQVLLGNGDGTFQPAVAYTTTGTAFGIATGDFNKDGIPDLIVTDSGAATAEVLLGVGDGTFGTPTSVALTASTSGNGLAVSDLNGDGDLDLAIASSNGIQILLGNGDGTFQAATTYGTGGYTSVAIGSVNTATDSFADLVAAPGCGG